ncbi:MAG: glycosyltransferase family 4 protein [Bacteroidia bacterium]|nr:glycosyltransferase family 4 protein [Bacteroidia bacterium]
MKIALLTDGIYPYVMGGMQRHSYYLCKFFLQKGIEVDLYHTHWELSKDIEALSVFTEEEKTKLRSFVIPWPSSSGLPGHYVRASYAYSKAVYKEFKMRSLDADFIYIKGFAGWKLLEEKAKGLRVAPCGVKFHGYEMYQLAPNWKVKLQHYMLRRPIRWNSLHADYVFSYGGGISKIIESLGIEKERILEFPSGIEESWIAKERTSVSSPKRFVFLGRYERRKGIEELFKVLNNYPDSQRFEFHFIGPIPEHLQPKGDAFIFHGKIFGSQKIKEILRSSDVLVCPSYSEGMPNVILEAMASGLYIISSDVGAVSAMVSEENGRLILPADEKGIRDAMEEVLAMDEQTLLQKKNNSIEKIKSDFMWPEIINQTLNKIEKISSNSLAVS